MSSMIPQPPPHISIGGPPGGPPGSPPMSGPPGRGGGDGPDSEQVKKLVSQAADLLRQAEDLEGDPGDQALIAKCVADLRNFIGQGQKELDTLMGGGPAAKIMRKNAPPAAGPTGY